MAAQFPFNPTGQNVFITDFQGKVIYSGPEGFCPKVYLDMLGKRMPEAAANTGRQLPSISGANPPQVTETTGTSATYLNLTGAY